MKAKEYLNYSHVGNLEEVGINQSEDSRYRNFFLRFGKYDNCHTLGTGKIRELLRIPKGSGDTRFYTRYCNKFPQWGDLKLKN